MSGLARLARARGARVTGSEQADSPAAATLRAEGFDVSARQTAATLPADATSVVASAAIPGDAPRAGRSPPRGLWVEKYAEALGGLMRLPGTVGVAIAGTHGKSSTTAMLAHVLLSCGQDPSLHPRRALRTDRRRQPVRGRGAPAAAGSGVLVAEACEFDRSFHHLAPTHAVVLNVEADHLDCYGSLDAIVASFARFAGLLPLEGSLLIQHESAARLAVAAGAAPGGGGGDARLRPPTRTGG